MLTGSFHLLILFDVAEAIRLDDVRGRLGVPSTARAPSFSRPVPEYVRFERPPVIETLPPIPFNGRQTMEGRLKYYDYGVVSVELELAFECDWTELVLQSSWWIANTEVEQRAGEILRPRLERNASALVKPYAEWLNEDYYIISLRSEHSAAEILAEHGAEIAQIVRGESAPLSEDEQREILQSKVSYYPTDLLVVGWTAAFVMDTPAGSQPTMQLLEYANTQLLEYRHYDELLTRVLEEVYASLERGSGFLRRWSMARKAEELNTIRLDVMELAERTDNAIKFLSDMFYARVYRLAAARVGVPDYRILVEDKLKTAGELYQFMVNQFHQARGFVLEVLVVVILMIEIVFLFRGKG
ncbi:MAG: hypothetical protein JWO80_1107 [Bryobacterales bacterium]|nr:hypothetical protein [Bryobacterales bacterium]